MSFCKRPFEEIEIHNTGEVYACCPNWNKFYSLGNIFKDSFEDVWNSDKAIDLRARILNNDYSLCDYEGCAYLKQNYFPNRYEYECRPKMDTYPLTVKFVYDYECNIACSICRDKLKRLSDEELELLNSKIDTFFLPMLKSAKVLIINAYGDPFGSRHSRLVIKKAAEKYPNLKFDFHTNGILCDETHFKNLNITPEKIDKIRISIHAATAKTYDKIVRGGGIYFPQIIKNLKYLQRIRKQCDFPVYIHFVITKFNYKEMPDFVKLAKKVNAIPCFWEFRQENCAYPNNDDNYIYREEHPLHKDFLKVLRNPILLTCKDNISPIIFNLIMKEQKNKKRSLFSSLFKT